MNDFFDPYNEQAARECTKNLFQLLGYLGIKLGRGFTEGEAYLNFRKTVDIEREVYSPEKIEELFQLGKKHYQEMKQSKFN